MKMQNYNNNLANNMLSLPSPEELMGKVIASEEVIEHVKNTRKAIASIIRELDPRKVLLVGPCSVHDEKAILEYAQKLKVLADKVSDKFLVIMRLYVEKPRTSLGWKGFINEPNLDGKYEIALGLEKARKLFLKVNELGLAVATEALDPFVPAYLSDLVSWYGIGARTVESPVHRELASGLEAPVGFKNAIDGRIEPAINACLVAKSSHSRITVLSNGQVGVVNTKGNAFAHIVLRGANTVTNNGVAFNATNADTDSILLAQENLKKRGLVPRLIVDCSHGNSGKCPIKSKILFEDIVTRIKNNVCLSKAIFGLMLESFLEEGSQPLSETMCYGQSVTDPCMSWDNTEESILKAYSTL